ncbi:hypothetical protein STENM327S_05035 [Streptomyces tendae]
MRSKLPWLVPHGCPASRLDVCDGRWHYVPPRAAGGRNSTPNPASDLRDCPGSGSTGGRCQPFANAVKASSTGRTRTELVSEPGLADRPNEDFASVGLPASGQGGSLVLLDGVTPPRTATGCLHSVPWFTARLGGALTELTVSLPDLPLAEALPRAIARTAAAHAETCDLSHPRTPQATAVSPAGPLAAFEYLACPTRPCCWRTPTVP